MIIKIGYRKNESSVAGLEEMVHRGIQDFVFESKRFGEQRCHARVVGQFACELNRYSRLNAACDSLESFMGVRPVVDDDLFALLSERRALVADRLAAANLEARLQEASEGVYLGIPFFSHCSDKQPVWLVNRTPESIIYVGRRLYAFASDDEGLSSYSAGSGGFADRIACDAKILAGEKLKIDDYTMRFDGDFIGTHRIVLLVRNEQVEMTAVVGKLGGHLWEEDSQGIHLLMPRS